MYVGRGPVLWTMTGQSRYQYTVGNAVDMGGGVTGQAFFRPQLASPPETREVFSFLVGRGIWQYASAFPIGEPLAPVAGGGAVSLAGPLLSAPSRGAIMSTSLEAAGVIRRDGLAMSGCGRLGSPVARPGAGKHRRGG